LDSWPELERRLPEETLVLKRRARGARVRIGFDMAALLAYVTGYRPAELIEGDAV
jgi:hypothetical protein